MNHPLQDDRFDRRQLLPTALALSRIVFAAAFAFVGHWWRFGLIIAAAASDRFDGYFARRWGVTATWGAALDAITDKLFVWTALITLTVEGIWPWWIILLLMARDFAVLFMIGWQAARGRWDQIKGEEHLFTGKVATVITLVLLLIVTATRAERDAIPQADLVIVVSYAIAVTARDRKSVV